jgi:ribosomal protein S12 methylthiotransferase
MITFGIISLGCPRNLVDSEFIINKLISEGFHFKDDLHKADIVIINTCGFIREAKEEAIDVILDVINLKKEGKIKKIIVGGCLSQRYGKELLEEIPEVDAIIGINWDELPKIIKNFNTEKILKVRKERKLLPFLPSKRIYLTPRHYIYLKISEGCSNRCSYCAIYNIKGSHKSRDIDTILKEARLAIFRGVKEINIISQDTTSYGIDLYGEPKLPELLKKMSRLSGEFWIRLLYMHPARMDHKVIDCFKNISKLCRYIDLPIQHINDKILKKMNRKATKDQIIRLIEKLRKEIPGVCLRTTVIVGFPGEGDREFKELLDFIRDVKFERLGCFVYSREEGTPAFNFKPQIPEKVKQARFDAVMKVQQKIALQVNSKFIGKKYKVLLDEETDDFYIGRAYFDAPEVDGVIYMEKNKQARVGEFVNAYITSNIEYDLFAEIT